jgi:hypothetical protein
MAWWKVSTTEKKSCEEREIWTKDGKTIVRINGFRWGTFNVETSDDLVPEGLDAANPDGVDMYSYWGDNVTECDLDTMDDGWYGDYKFEGIGDDEQEELKEAMEDDYYDYLEANGWSNNETEAWLFGPLEINKDNDA